MALSKLKKVYFNMNHRTDDGNFMIKTYIARCRVLTTMVCIAIAVIISVYFTGCGDTTTQESQLLKDPLYINDAGVVIVAPFIPALFKRANIHLSTIAPGETPGPDYIRAALMLQYIVGNYDDVPISPLIKVLCALPIDADLPQSSRLSDGDKHLCDQLLLTLIASWTAIGNSSVNGFQENFLQREGKFEILDDHYKLMVQRKTFDELMNQMPWSFYLVYLPWMPVPLYTTW